MERRGTISDRRKRGCYIAHDRRSGIADRRSFLKQRLEENIESLERAICNLIKLSKMGISIDEKK